MQDPEDAPPDDQNVAAIAPHDAAAERYVLGAVLQSETALAACTPLVQGHHFYQPKHETVWNILQDMAQAGHPTEPQALLSALREAGQLTKIGGGPYLHSMISEATSPANAVYYARQVVQLANRRSALAAARMAVQRLSTPGPASDTDEVLAATATALSAATAALADPNPSTTWAAVDLAAALEGRSLDPPPDMCARTDGICLFYSSSVHTLAGEPESGKTWVALHAATQLLAMSLPVVFIDFEDRAERVVGRLLGLGCTPQRIRDHFTYIRPDRPLDLAGQQAVAHHLTHAVLVIIDGVTEAMTMHGLEIDSNKDAAVFNALLPRWIADHGPGVVQIDHVVKDKEKQGRWALGAQHKLAGLDGASYTVKAIQRFGRNKRGVAHISVNKDRAGHVREHARGDHIADFVLDDTGRDIEPGTPHLTTAQLEPPEDHLGDDGFEPTVLMTRLWAYISAHPGLSQRALFDAVSGKEKAKKLALELLVSNAHVTVERGPNRAQLHHPGTPYPPDDDPDEPTLDSPWNGD